MQFPQHAIHQTPSEPFEVKQGAISMSNFLLKDRVVLVSGIGPGLGRNTALACARQGADIVLAARTASRLEEVAKEVEATGQRALCVQSDISKDEDCANVVARAVEHFGQLDVLVNNAFTMPPFKDLVDTPLDVIRETFEVNLYAALRMSREAAPHLEKSVGGSIVMINSSVMRSTRPAFGAYKMAKHALLALAQSLACELGPKGIRVNSIAPGFIGEVAADGLAALQSHTTGVPAKTIKAQIVEAHMLRQIPEPNEIADCVVFLASDLSRVVTGQCLDVNGGEFTH
jgi:NAD(P)-dependent dehydrogenase (short-subunit alcohol dehydrogenase family)